MREGGIWIYIIIMAITTNLIRILPVTVIRKKITNRYLKSFLYYVPYVTLAVMTFPAIMDVTSSPLAGLVALLCGIVAAWAGLGLFPVSVICCISVFVFELFI